MIKNQKMTGNLLLTLTALIWGMAFVFQRKGMESIEPITFTSARMALAAVAVGIAAFIYTKKPVAKTVPAETKKIPSGKNIPEAKKYPLKRKEKTVGKTLFSAVFAAGHFWPAPAFSSRWVLFTRQREKLVLLRQCI